jgi:hypothetical protein
MKWDRIMKVACGGFFLAGGPAFIQGWLHWRDVNYWAQLQHLTPWLLLMSVAMTCGVFFLVAAWPQAWPTYRRWLGLKEAPSNQQ